MVFLAPLAAQRIVAVIAAAEEQAELRQSRNGAGEGGGDGHGQGIAAADMGQFVGDHGRDFAGFEVFQEARGHRDRGVLRIAAGGEGIGLLGLDDIDRRGRDAGLAREDINHVIELGHAGALHRHGILHAQHQLVGIPVAEEIGHQREAEGDHHA